MTMTIDGAMATTTMPTAFAEALVRQGFRRRGREAYVRGEHSLSVCGKWLVVEAAAGELRPRLGSFGPWKAAGERIDVFEVPVAAIFDAPSIDDDESCDRAVAELAGWYAAAQLGATPAGWMPPDAARLRKATGPEAWSLQIGAQVRQVELDVEAQRAALRVTLATAEVRPSAARYERLRDLVGFTDRQWRWVRLGVVDGDRPRVVAEVDLTGCPAATFETLTLHALTALRRVAEQMLTTVLLLSDSRVSCASWESPLV